MFVHRVLDFGHLRKILNVEALALKQKQSFSMNVSMVEAFMKSSTSFKSIKCFRTKVVARRVQRFMILSDHIIHVRTLSFKNSTRAINDCGQ